MKLFVIQYLNFFLLIVLPMHVHSIFFKKLLFGWGPPSYPGYPYPGYPPSPPPPGFGGLVGAIVGKFLSAKYGPPPAYPYPGYPPPFPGPFPPSYPNPFPPFGFPPAFPAALPVPVNVPVPYPVDRPFPIPYGKPSLLPPITFVKHVSESSKGGMNYNEAGNSHSLFKLFQMTPPEKSASSWKPMHQDKPYGNHKEDWF